MPGFRFSETMRGSWRARGSNDDRPISFSVTAHAASILKHIFDHQAKIEGRLQADGLVADTHAEGSLTIDLLGEHVIRYNLSFVADDGRRLHLRGQKDVRLFDFAHTMTTLPAALYDDAGDPLGSALLTFDKRELPSFVAGFRPTL